MKRKTVFLFNTHLDNIMNSPERLLIQLESIIEEFEKREDVVLLWRPHPLSMETLYSMQIEYADRYKRVVEKFQNMANGIYDTSGEWKNAVSVSDAYIGDYSSLAYLYMFTGKPLLIMEPLRHGRIRGTIQFIAGAQYGEWIYFSAVYFNGLFKLNIKTNEIISLGAFEKEKADCSLHMRAVVWDKQCWFIPKSGKYITRVDLDTLEKSYISMETLDSGNRGSHKFINIVQHHNYLWLIPAFSGSIIELNMQDGGVKTIDNWPEDLNLSTGGLNFYGAGYYKGKVILCPYSANKLVLLDTAGRTMKSYPWNFPQMAFSSMLVIGDELWFIPRWWDSIVTYNIHSDSWNHIKLPAEISKVKEKFITAYYGDGKLWLVPCHAGAILKLDLDGNVAGQITNYSKSMFEPFANCEKGDFIHVFGTETYVFFTSFYGKSLLCAHLPSEEIRYLNLSYSEDEIYNLREKNRADGHTVSDNPVFQYIEDSSFCSVEKFVDKVKHSDDPWKEKREQAIGESVEFKGISGKTIWDTVKAKIKD